MEGTLPLPTLGGSLRVHFSMTLLQQVDDLEIRIFKGYKSPFEAELQMPDGTQAFTSLPDLPWDSLERATDPDTYGRALFDWLFQDQIAAAFEYALRFAHDPIRQQSKNALIRLRLWIDPKAEVLVPLRWECLLGARPNGPLSLEMAFSRFLRLRQPRVDPIWERPLRMLLATAGPPSPTAYSFAATEAAIAQAIADAPIDSWGPFLKLDRLEGPCSLENIRKTLERAQQEQRAYHIIHIMAHALVRDGQELLALADVDGNVEHIPADSAASMLAPMIDQPPYLIFLGTPQSGQQLTTTLQTALGMRLIEAGAQAVITIQPPMDEHALLHFTDRFYREFIAMGAADLAMSAARAAIYDPQQWAWSFPILYTRIANLQVALSGPAYNTR